MWFTAAAGDYIGRLSVVDPTVFHCPPERIPLEPGTDPRGIGTGPDGRIWFTGYVSFKIGVINVVGP